MVKTMKTSSITFSLFGAACLALTVACGGGNSAPAGTVSPATASAQKATSAGAIKPVVTTPASTSSAGDERISVSAVDLYKAYDKDEPAADEKYKGQQLLVTGIIEDITLEGESGVNIDLKAGDILDTIFCFFEDSEKASVSKLKKGQKVTIRGVGEGKFVNPVVRFCEVAS